MVFSKINKFVFSIFYSCQVLKIVMLFIYVLWKSVLEFSSNKFLLSIWVLYRYILSQLFPNVLLNDVKSCIIYLFLSHGEMSFHIVITFGNFRKFLISIDCKWNVWCEKILKQNLFSLNVIDTDVRRGRPKRMQERK